MHLPAQRRVPGLASPWLVSRRDLSWVLGRLEALGWEVTAVVACGSGYRVNAQRHDT